MVAKIRIEAEAATQAGFQQIVQQAGNVEKALTSAEKEAHDLRKELENRAATAYKERINALADAFSPLNKKLKETEAGLKDVNKAAGGGGRLSGAVTATASAVSAVADVFREMKQAGRDAYEVVMKLAEEGNPGAVALAESFKGVGEALRDVANDPAIQGFMTDLAKGIKTEVIPALQKMPDYYRATVDGLASWITKSGEFFHVYEEGTTALLEQDQKRRDSMNATAKAAIEAAQRLNQIKKDQSKVEDEIGKVQAQRDAADNAAELRKIDNIKTLNRQLELERQWLRDLARDGGLTDKILSESTRRQTQLEARKDEVVREQAAAQQKAIEDQKRADVDAEKTRLQLLEEQRKAHFDALAKQKAAADKHREEELKKWNEHINKIKDALKGQDGKGGAAERLVGGLDRHKMGKSIGDHAAAQAGRDFDTENKFAATGKMGEDGRRAKAFNELIGQTRKGAEAEFNKKHKGAEKTLNTGDQDHDRKAYESYMKAQKAFMDNAERKIRQQNKDAATGDDHQDRDLAKHAGGRRKKEMEDARRGAQRDFQKGKADPEAMAKAIEENAGAQINNAKEQGKLTGDQAAALARATQELVNNGRELSAMQKNLDAINKQLSSTATEGERRRAQKQGGR